MNDQDQTNQSATDQSATDQSATHHSTDATVHELPGADAEALQGGAAKEAADEPSSTPANESSESLERLRAQLADANARIAALGAELDAQRRTKQLREAMEDAGAVRVRDAVRAAEAIGPAADASGIAGVVERVRAAHPAFFAATTWPSTNAPAAGARDEPSVDRLAARARASNDRRALLEYLRARRL